MPSAAATPPPLEPVPASEKPAAAPGRSAGTKPAVTKSSPTRAKPAAAGAASRTGRASRDTGTDDPCAGLDGAELDDCLGFDAGDARDEEPGRDFAAEQRQRDRALMQREAADRAAAADEPSYGAGDEPVDPQDELPPDEYDPAADDGYDPDEDEPPPGDNGL